MTTNPPTPQAVANGDELLSSIECVTVALEMARLFVIKYCDDDYAARLIRFLTDAKVENISVKQGVIALSNTRHNGDSK